MESNNKNYYVLGVIVIAIIAGAVYLFSSSKKESVLPVVNTPTTIMPAVNTPPMMIPGVSTTTAIIPSLNTTMATASVARNLTSIPIFYTDKGFLPSSIELAVGTTVVFTNHSSGLMWVASAVHPTHQALPGFDQLTAKPKNATYEYTFTKTGSWKYHSNLKPEMGGTVTIK